MARGGRYRVVEVDLEEAEAVVGPQGAEVQLEVSETAPLVVRTAGAQVEGTSLV